MRETCFMCGARAWFRDRATGEGLCWAHNEDARRRHSEGRKLQAKADDAWTRLRNIQQWHAGSAYERHQAMAKRLAGVTRT